MAISFVYTDTTGRLIKKEGRIIRDVVVLVAEILAIRNALDQAIIENDSLIAIQDLTGKFIVPINIL